MTDKALRFLDIHKPATPCIVLDVDRVEENYAAIIDAIPGITIHYAVKANPARRVIERLVSLGCSFDAASWPEIALCLEMGAPGKTISFGTTIKKGKSIKEAHENGIGMYAFDSREELCKIAAHAPGASVYCRLSVDNIGAAWSLAGKFGTDTASAAELLTMAADIGLDPCGVSFHVGSQQRSPEAFTDAIRRAGDVFAMVGSEGLKMRLLNIGGGLPTKYREDVAPLSEFGDTIGRALDAVFGDDRPQLLAEPGRGLVADAALMRSEVVLACTRGSGDQTRWIYLDIGRFGGLAETEGEAIAYRITTTRDGSEEGPVILAGPTCDSTDTLYRNSGYMLPLSLTDGDLVTFHAAGAYISTYASLGFNGFGPPGEYFL